MGFSRHLVFTRGPQAPFGEAGNHTQHPQSPEHDIKDGEGAAPRQNCLGEGVAVILSIPSTVWCCRLVPARAPHVASIPPSLRAPSPPGRKSSLFSGLISYTPASATATSFPFISSFCITDFSFVLLILTVPHHCPLCGALFPPPTSLRRLLVAWFWPYFCFKSSLQTRATMSPGEGLPKVSSRTDLGCRTRQAAGS